MNAVVVNKYTDLFNNLDIEVSKKLEGIYEVDDIINTFKNFFFNIMFLDITSIKDYKNISNLKKLSISLDMDKVILFLDKDDAISKSHIFLSKLVSMGIYNFTDDSNALMYLYNNPNIYRDVAHYQEIEKDSIIENTTVDIDTFTRNRKILGIKNITDDAGSTTLAYLIKETLKNYFSTMVIEIDKMDLSFFKDKDTLSVKDDKLKDILDKYDGVDIFVIDLNKSKNEYICTDILYLIEPSTIKLNKLVSINPGIFHELKDKKIVLNKSLLDDKDIEDFERESNLKVFYNIGVVNDRNDNNDIFIPLLTKLGYIHIDNTDEGIKEEKKGLFSFLKNSIDV